MDYVDTKNMEVQKMKEKMIRARLGNDNSFYFRCPLKVKVDDLVLVEGDNNEKQHFLVEEVFMFSEEETGVDLRVFKEVVKVVGNNKDLKLFKKPSYPMVEVSKEINKQWSETSYFLGYAFAGCNKLISLENENSDAIISVWGTNLNGHIVARVGDVFDDHFVEFAFNYYNPEQFKYFMNNIKVEFFKYIHKQISKEQLKKTLDEVRHV